MKIDALRVGKENDGRIHVVEIDRIKIKQLHEQGIAIREIARRYEHICSRRLIQFILFPERLRGGQHPGKWKLYYSKEKHRDYMRKHRMKKRDLQKVG